MCMVYGSKLYWQKKSRAHSRCDDLLSGAVWIEKLSVLATIIYSNDPQGVRGIQHTNTT